MNGVKVSGCSNGTIPMSAMKDGDLAVVVECRNNFFNGLIVHARKDGGGADLYQTIGKPHMSRWTRDSIDGVTVSLLKAGDTITVC